MNAHVFKLDPIATAYLEQSWLEMMLQDSEIEPFNVLSIASFMSSLPVDSTSRQVVRFADTIESTDVKWCDRHALLTKNLSRSCMLNSGRSFNVPIGYALILYGHEIQPVIVTSENTAPIILFANVSCSSLIKCSLVKLCRPATRIKCEQVTIRSTRSGVVIGNHSIDGDHILATDRNQTIWVSKPYHRHNATNGHFSVISIKALLIDFDLVRVDTLSSSYVPGLDYNWKLVFGNTYKQRINCYRRYVELVKIKQRIDSLTSNKKIKRLLYHFGATLSYTELVALAIKQQKTKLSQSKLAHRNSLPALLFHHKQQLLQWTFG